MRPPLRIVHFADTPRRGGAELVLLRNVAAQLNAGHEVDVLTPQTWMADEVRELPGAKAAVVGDDAFRDILGLRRQGMILRQIPALVSALRKRRPDVLHVNNGGYPGSDLARVIVMVARALRIPRIVMSVHAVPKLREGEIALAEQIDWVVWRCVDVVIGATHAVEAALAERREMPSHLFHLAPYGVEDPGGDDDDARALRAHLGVEDGALLVGMLSATDDEQKGHAVLVEAVADTPEVHAAIAGARPPIAAGAERVARVHVLGRVEHIGTFLRACDVMSVPSVRDESLPLVVLEAMAAGRPVVASRLSGIPEAVEDRVTGLLVQPGDAAALTAALGEVRDDRNALVAFGAAAREHWRTGWTVEAMTAATIRAYER